MFEFFRKYQRYFFALITVVIVISFSFFGTYSSISSDPIRDKVIFTAIEGTPVKRSTLDEMVVFISSDSEDKQLFGGMWGPNFLNDGVIKKNLLETGLAQILANQYLAELNVDLVTRFEKEKRYVPYVHPQAKFINAPGAWEYFAPTLKRDYETYVRTNQASTPEAFDQRVNLFLGEKAFSPVMLKQILRYQEKQYTWITPDPDLQHQDLSLFGYHTLEDWFGPRFVRLSAEFIINAAKLAQQKGYIVTKEEALADLLRNAEISYRQNINSPYLGVANFSQYFEEQLRRLGMDQGIAVRVWQEVLLFRRLFEDVGNAVFADLLTQQQFDHYAKESVSGDLYRLPLELRLNDYRALQKLELYLNAVSKRGTDLLALPTEYLSAQEIEGKYPELVQKQYLLEIASINKKLLQAKVGLRDTWNWELDENHWKALQKEFPELGVKKGKTREERDAALEGLDEMTRARVDSFARAAIVNEHPEWIEKALQDAEAKRKVVGLSTKGESLLFSGLKNGEELMKALDAESHIARFTADGNIFYRIEVIDRASNKEILTFEEAKKSAILDHLLDKELERFYTQIRDLNPADFKKQDGSWKTFHEAENQVADKYFAKSLKALQAKSPQKNFTGDQAAAQRFMAHGKEILSRIQKDPEAFSLYVRASQPLSGEKDKVPAHQKLNEQWRLEKSSVNIARGGEEEAFDKKELFSLSENQWTEVHGLPNGDLYFFQLTNKDPSIVKESNGEKHQQLHKLLSEDAQKHYMQKALEIIKSKNAISLAYLDQPVETLEVETPVAPMME